MAKLNVSDGIQEDPQGLTTLPEGDSPLNPDLHQSGGYKRGGVKVAETRERIPFQMTPENPHPVCYLERVFVDFVEDEKKGTKVPRLNFSFCTPDRVQGTTQRIRPIVADNHYTGKDGNPAVFTMADQEARDANQISHLFDAFMGVGATAAYDGGKGIGAGADSELDFFNRVQAAFNTARDGKPVFQDKNGKYILSRIKVIYNSGGYLEFPRYGNFFEVVHEGVKTSLVHRSGDVIVPPKKASDAAKALTTGNAEGGYVPPAGGFGGFS